MASRLLIDLDSLDLSRDVMPQAELRSLLPHAFEFQLIDGVCHLDLEDGSIVGYKDWGPDPWWGRGHVPGRPLMPGVLLCEGGAQIATILMKKKTGWGLDRFIGLGGLDNVRFRGLVEPPCRVYFASRVGSYRRNLAINPAQAFVDGKMVMEMELMGVLL
jgi:3-hydroxyacyl-[acyl-carrier-protein] dehydratase